MDSNYRVYDIAASSARIAEYLKPQSGYEEVDELPSREKLTFSNGFYANCSAIFVDIRGSSSLPQNHKRPALAKLYRAYISEVVAVLNSSLFTREVNIVGDGVWAVVNTPKQDMLQDVFIMGCRVNSMMRVFNYHLDKSTEFKTKIKIGIGMAYGRALMIKAGYNGSGINDIVYMGDVVNRAAKLAAKGSESVGVPPMMIDEIFQGNLTDHQKSLTRHDWARGCYTANAIIMDMETWYNENCT